MERARKERYWRWVDATAFGELAGFAVPAVAWGAAAAAGLGDVPTAAIVVVAGAGEGAVLGYAQSRVLRDELPHFDERRWIGLTAAAASGAWAIGMVPSTFHEQLSAWPVGVLVVLGVLGGSALLVSIGAAQALELRRHVRGAWRWIPANVLGWIAGLPLPFIVMSMAPDSTVARLVFAIAAGFGMGAAVGAVTGRFLDRLLGAPPERSASPRWCEARVHRSRQRVAVHHHPHRR